MLPLSWSRVRESNPPSQLGKLEEYRYTNPACLRSITQPHRKCKQKRKLIGASFSQLVKKVPWETFLTALPRRAFWPYTKCCFRKALQNKAFRAAGYCIRELRFAAACGRYRQSAVSAAAPLAGRRVAGPGMAMRQGEQGALPPRAPPLLCFWTFQQWFFDSLRRICRQSVYRPGRISRATFSVLYSICSEKRRRCPAVSGEAASQRAIRSVERAA